MTAVYSSNSMKAMLKRDVSRVSRGRAARAGRPNRLVAMASASPDVSDPTGQYPGRDWVYLADQHHDSLQVTSTARSNTAGGC